MASLRSHFLDNFALANTQFQLRPGPGIANRSRPTLIGFHCDQRFVPALPRSKPPGGNCAGTSIARKAGRESYQPLKLNHRTAMTFAKAELLTFPRCPLQSVARHYTNKLSIVIATTLNICLQILAPNAGICAAHRFHNSRNG
jgi:hypothetical protein